MQRASLAACAGVSALLGWILFAGGAPQQGTQLFLAPAPPTQLQAGSSVAALPFGAAPAPMVEVPRAAMPGLDRPDAALGAVAFCAAVGVFAVLGQRAAAAERPASVALLAVGGEEEEAIAAPEETAVRAPDVVMQAGDWNIGKEGMSQALPFLKRPAGLGAPGTMAGDVGFDPLQISDLVPIQWAREAELKHARVCMLAWAGWVAVDLGFRVPYAPEVSSLLAHDATVEKGPMLGLLIPLALIEVGAGIPKCFQIMNDPDAAPGGDYKFDPLGFGGGRELEEKELANGRLAILGFSGTVTQAVLTGNGFPYTYNGLSDLIPPIGMGPGP